MYLYLFALQQLNIAGVLLDYCSLTIRHIRMHTINNFDSVYRYNFFYYKGEGMYNRL